MAHPSEYYVKFLLAQSWGSDDEVETEVALGDTLREMNLPIMTEEYFGRIMRSFKPPRSFRFNDREHMTTRRFMEKEKILTLWDPSEDDVRTLRVLLEGHQRLRRILHILLMGNVPSSVISDKLTSRFRIHPGLSERMVDTYRHYFWNTDRASYQEWSILLCAHPDESALLRSLDCGPAQALYRSGFHPRMDSAAALKEALRQAYFRLEALRYAPDCKDTINTYTKLSGRLLQIHEALNSEGAGLSDQLRHFRQITMSHQKPNVTPIDDLVDRDHGGSYSGDGKEPLTQ